jgi:hypothetical protein
MVTSGASEKKFLQNIHKVNESISAQDVENVTCNIYIYICEDYSPYYFPFKEANGILLQWMKT